MAHRRRLRSAHARQTCKRRGRQCRNGIRFDTIPTSHIPASVSFPSRRGTSPLHATEGREPINPRPRQYTTIFRATQNDTIGFIAYSEGCNDDVNKFIWTALGWDQDTPVIETLRQYSRFFLGEQYSDTFAQGLLALESNWDGPVLTNGGIETTLQQFQDMERDARPRDLLNWQLQQGLYRAYYDAYVRQRLVFETDLEARAIDELRHAGTVGSLAALDRAHAVLDRALRERTVPDLRRNFRAGRGFVSKYRTCNSAWFATRRSGLAVVPISMRSIRL